MLFSFRRAASGGPAVAHASSGCCCVLAAALAACGPSLDGRDERATPRAEALVRSSARASTAEDAAAERALAYLDGRAQTWVTTPWTFVNSADRTCALSCHTTMPYVLARSVASTAGIAAFDAVLDRVKDRVATWSTIVPYYDWAKPSSRATEAVVSAVALAAASRNGSVTAAVVTSSRDHAWALQTSDGDWDWLQEDLGPFEDSAARYWGAALYALSLSFAPASSTTTAAPSGAAFDRLRTHLRSAFDAQNLHAKTMAAWADLRVPGLLTADKTASVVTALRDAQHCDGGFALASLGRWSTATGVLDDPTSSPSDGYGTALATIVLGESGASQTRVAKARQWLMSHQLASGAWPMRSLNRPGTSFNDTVISDAGAAYGAIALRTEPAAGHSVPPTNWLNVAPTASTPSAWTRDAARSECTNRGYRLPSLVEMKKLADDELLRCTIKTGWAWTNDAGTTSSTGRALSFAALAATDAALTSGTDTLLCVK